MKGLQTHPCLIFINPEDLYFALLFDSQVVSRGQQRHIISTYPYPHNFRVISGSSSVSVRLAPLEALIHGDADHSRRITPFLVGGREPTGMTFEEDDRVVLHDEHSDYDGEEGTIAQVVETMFGDENYTVSFEEGQEAGVPADALDPADDEE